MRLIEWDSLEMRISGQRLAGVVREVIGGKPPIESIDLQFENGLLRVVGKLRKLVLISFTVEIKEIRAGGTILHVPLSSASAAGLPLPTILFGLMKSQLPKDLIGYEEPATIVIFLDRFLPSFVRTEIQQVWIVEGGLVVKLGRGGADLPPGGIHESQQAKRDERSVPTSGG